MLFTGGKAIESCATASDPPLPSKSHINTASTSSNVMHVHKRASSSHSKATWPSCSSAACPPSWFALTQNDPCLLLPLHQNDLLCALWCEREAHLWQCDNRRMQIPGISCGRRLQIEMRSEEEDQLPADEAQQVKQMHILLCAVKKKKITRNHISCSLLGKTGQERCSVYLGWVTPKAAPWFLWSF